MLRLGEALEDTSGGMSAMRVAFLSFMIPFSLVYCATCWRTKEIARIPAETVGLVATLCAAKVLQRKVEESAPAKDSSNAPH